MRTIKVKLTDETLAMADNWKWLRIDWSYEVNLALQLLYDIRNKNNPVADVFERHRWSEEDIKNAQYLIKNVFNKENK